MTAAPSLYDSDCSPNPIHREGRRRPTSHPITLVVSGRPSARVQSIKRGMSTDRPSRLMTTLGLYSVRRIRVLLLSCIFGEAEVATSSPLKMLYPLECGIHSDCLLAGDPRTIPHGPIVNSNLGPLMEGFPKSPKLEAHVKLEGFLWGRPHDVCSARGFSESTP